MYKKLQSLVFMIPVFFIGLLLLTFLLSCGENDSQTVPNPYNQYGNTYPYGQYNNGTYNPYGNYPNANYNPYGTYNGGFNIQRCSQVQPCPSGYYCKTFSPPAGTFYMMADMRCIPVGQ